MVEEDTVKAGVQENKGLGIIMTIAVAAGIRLGIIMTIAVAAAAAVVVVVAAGIHPED